MCDEPDAECGRRETYRSDGKDVDSEDIDGRDADRAGYFRVTKA
jgi:hypothetical protein